MGPYRIGKVDKKVFEEIIFPHLGAVAGEVAVGPSYGVDFAVVDVGDKSLIFEVDPVFVVPQYGWERSGWFAVHILASDVAVSGVPPRYLFIDLNLPLSMRDEELKTLWMAIHRECEKLGIAIVGGHTGRYGGVDYPMLGGAVMMGVTGRGNYVTPADARPGDLVLMTKGPAVEAAGILSVMFPSVLEAEYGSGFAREAQGIFWLQTVVPDALALAGAGLKTVVTAMHDATEYGVWGALHDVSESSRVGIRVYRDRLFIRGDVAKVLKAFEKYTGMEIDPFAAISEGTLIATVKRSRVSEALEALRRAGVEAAVIGEVVEGSGVELVDASGVSRVDRPLQDPFWPVFFEVMEKLGGGR
ncbi:AIR synthase family protein [Desulfurococcus mucosus]|uniref:AIR synthase related protein domain protein n=1 Tax=Desulfurococcus mucosus (strain ATCC 35584 / DSM 2162 / JCM 9187 / O7/1) TaxID=765177 RepID=E8R8M7_DESM0|nr:AIR synthase family protein [Desulfurococcus mucosus]ADV64853.1 AIR synthase related protein domain protein [Desulfurococcus mucosus DSM 2162]